MEVTLHDKSYVGASENFVFVLKANPAFDADNSIDGICLDQSVVDVFTKGMQWNTSFPAVRFEQYLHQPRSSTLNSNPSAPMDIVVWTAFFIARLKAILLGLQSGVFGHKRNNQVGVLISWISRRTSFP